MKKLWSFLRAVPTVPPSCCLRDVVTRQGWLPDNREEIVGSRSTERSSTVGLIKYPQLFFREDFLSRRFSFKKIFFREDFLWWRFSFEKIFFWKEFVWADFLLSRFSIDNNFSWRFFLSVIFSFEKVKNNPTLVYRLPAPTNLYTLFGQAYSLWYD